MVEKILNNTTPYGKIRASYEGSLHSSTLKVYLIKEIWCDYIPGIHSIKLYWSKFCLQLYTVNIIINITIVPIISER